MSFTRFKKVKANAKQQNRSQLYLEDTLKFFGEISNPLYEIDSLEMGVDILQDSHLCVEPRRLTDEDSQMSETFWITRGMAGTPRDCIGDVSWL